MATEDLKRLKTRYKEEYFKMVQEEEDELDIRFEKEKAYLDEKTNAIKGMVSGIKKTSGTWNGAI